MLPCLVVAMCATTGGATCDGFKPLRPTTNDIKVISDRLAGDLLANNEYGRRVCGWK